MLNYNWVLCTARRKTVSEQKRKQKRKAKSRSISSSAFMPPYLKLNTNNLLTPCCPTTPFPTLPHHHPPGCSRTNGVLWSAPIWRCFNYVLMPTLKWTDWSAFLFRTNEGGFNAFRAVRINSALIARQSPNFIPPQSTAANPRLHHLRSGEQNRINWSGAKAISARFFIDFFAMQAVSRTLKPKG